jgi:hypothetical protein
VKLFLYYADANLELKLDIDFVKMLGTLFMFRMLVLGILLSCCFSLLSGKYYLVETADKGGAPPPGPPSLTGIQLSLNRLCTTKKYQEKLIST